MTLSSTSRVFISNPTSELNNTSMPCYHPNCGRIHIPKRLISILIFLLVTFISWTTSSCRVKMSCFLRYETSTPISGSHSFQPRIMAWKTRVIKAVDLGFELLQRKVPLNIGGCNIHTASGIDVATSSIALVRQLKLQTLFAMPQLHAGLHVQV